MLQMRLNPGDSRLYNPDRDVAHHFAHIGRLVADRMAERAWPDLIKPFLAHEGVTEEQLGEATAAFARFFNYCVDPEVETCKQALEKSGWFQVSVAAQFVICTVLGQLMIGVYFQGIRDSTRLGDGPAANVKDLVKAAEAAYRVLAGPRLFSDV